MNVCILNDHASPEMLHVTELHCRCGIRVGVAASSEAFIIGEMMSM
jgi:hypothetical protein